MWDADNLEHYAPDYTSLKKKKKFLFSHTPEKPHLRKPWALTSDQPLPQQQAKVSLSVSQPMLPALQLLFRRLCVAAGVTPADNRAVPSCTKAPRGPFLEAAESSPLALVVGDAQVQQFTMQPASAGPLSAWIQARVTFCTMSNSLGFMCTG